MKFRAEQIAGIINASIEGDVNVEINSLGKIEEGKEGELCFLANPKYEEYLYTTNASIVIISKDLDLKQKVNEGVTLLRVDEPYQCFAKLLEQYNKQQHPSPGIDSTAVLNNATIGNNVFIGAYVVLEEGVSVGDDTIIYPHTYVGKNTSIGDKCLIFSGVKIYHGCKIGNNCTIHSGTIIGADGFGFAPNSENEYNKVPQIGNVILEDWVEIGANTCIDRATIGSTLIQKGVKLDNLIQIGHNVNVGTNSVMAAQVGVAGSTKIGENSMFGGQVGVNGHINIAKGTMVGAQSGIASSVKKENQVLLGSPSVEADQMKKMYMAYRRLPQILNQVRELQQEIIELKNAHK
jgi:UDP-3-O-[3-hydroxymyristoyl] glucosamine N-acyltransferase